MRLTKHLQSIFWDVDARTLDPRRHKKFIISRVADKGAWADVIWLKKTFGLSAIKKNVASSRNVSARTKSFWHLA